MTRAARALVAVVALTTSACVRHYRPPGPDEPHAVAKLRRVYQTTVGEGLVERTTLNDFEVINLHRDLPEAPRTSALRIHPEPAAWRVRSGFFHVEMRYVNVPYQVRETYPGTETYSCGSAQSYRTCTRSVTRYRYVTRYRTEYRPVRVFDDRCEARLRHRVVEGRNYLLQFTYLGDGVCRLSCVEQFTGESGRGRPCELAPENP